jgi:hypothetical protein
MSPDSMDDNLEQVHVEWLRRLERCEVSREEVQGVLPGMKARLEFLRNLHSSVADDSGVTPMSGTLTFSRRLKIRTSLLFHESQAIADSRVPHWNSR